MTADTLLAEIAKKSDFVFAAWNVLMMTGLGVVVAAAVLRHDRRVGLTLRVGFGFFAVTHLLGMLHVLKQWASLEGALKLLATQAVMEKLEFAALAPQAVWVVPFHLTFTGFVIAAVWWVGRSRNPAVNETRTADAFRPT